jgi:hypothetical protein
MVAFAPNPRIRRSNDILGIILKIIYSPYGNIEHRQKKGNPSCRMHP